MDSRATPEMQVTLGEIRENPNLMEHLRLELTPEDIFRPRYAGQGDMEKLKAEIQGYFFYVEIIENGPELMLMRNVGLKSKTLGQLMGVPPEHLTRIISDPKANEVASMYSIDKELKDWLKEQLGL